MFLTSCKQDSDGYETATAHKKYKMLISGHWSWTGSMKPEEDVHITHLTTANLAARLQNEKGTHFTHSCLQPTRQHSCSTRHSQVHAFHSSSADYREFPHARHGILTVFSFDTLSMLVFPKNVAGHMGVFLEIQGSFFL